MPRLQITLAAAAWIFGTLGADVGTSAQVQPRPAVIELFTSEGCSSCPPAEAYLGELALRPDVLALAFHVDYWEAFILRYHEGLSMEDVAETLSVKPGAAKIRCIAVSQNCATSF